MRWLAPLLFAAALVCLLTAPAAAGGVRHRRQVSGAGCRDQAGRPGVCLTLARCPTLNRLQAGGLSTSELRTLRSHLCSPTAFPLLFCCVPGTSSITFTRDSLPFSGAPEQHPNRPLVELGDKCGSAVLEKIRGGTEVRLGQYPWVTLLGYRDSLQPRAGITFECGGSIISQRYVLTAAHCITDTGTFQLERVRLGEHRISAENDCQVQNDGNELCNAPEEFGVEKVIFHENYNQPALRMNDIALIRLDRPIIETKFISKVCLPFLDAGVQNITGQNLIVAGFGRTGPDSDSPKSDVLLQVDLPFVSLASCQRTYRGAALLARGQFCAGGQPGRDSCRGDSGGPVMVESRFGTTISVIGVVSFGPDACGTPGFPSINTRVSEYLNWILDNMEE